jgi:signal transduction histidine kinase/ActR/RegA family two-component response regulator
MLTPGDMDRAVYRELLRLPLKGIQAATLPGLLIIALLYLALTNDANRVAMTVWCAVATLTRLGCTLHARQRTHWADTPELVRRLLFELRLIFGFEGALWGALPWITFDTCTVMANVLAIGAILGISASRMMQLSPAPSVFLSYILTGALVTTPKVLFFEGIPYHALGLGGLIFVIVLIRQAGVNRRTLETSIRLQFEKQQLLEQLHAQMAITEAARQSAEATLVVADNAKRAKSRFLAAASHDLRQPTQAQGLFLELLSRTALDEHQRQLLDHLRGAYCASVDLLDSLLDFSRLEAGVVQPKLQNFALQPLLTRIEKEYGPQADAKDLIYRCRETDLVLHCDPALVELILRNLVSNAIRYTHRGGVLVACRKRGSLAVLEVWDTGIGIAAEHYPEVFREFQQLNNPERDRHKGLGLGLAIVDSLAHQLGLSVGLASRVGRGSVFRVSLPTGTGLPPAESAAIQAPEQPCHARVLVIDDEQAVRTGLRLLLQEWGCQCDAVESIEEALAIAGQHRPSVVISDYRLRGHATGAQAIQALRGLLGQSLPALLITGDTAPERLAEAHASGITLLHKPVPPEELRRQLYALMEDSAA